MAARVVAFMNFKGGVGKTASVVNLGACLAQFHNQRVLVVDLDPQASASLWLMTLDQYRDHTARAARTVSQLFNDYIKGTNAFDIEKAIVRGVPFREVPLIPKLDLLPAAVDLIKIEERIQDSRQNLPHTFLRRSLVAVLDRYDYILLDCPPNFYSVARNAVFAADDIVVPYIPDFLSLSGVEIFTDLVADFYKKIANHLTGRRKPGISAFIVSHYMARQNVFEQGVNDLEILADLLRDAGKVRKEARVLQPGIRRCVRVAEAAGRHLPVILHDRQSNGAIDYSALADDFTTQLRAIK